MPMEMRLYTCPRTYGAPKVLGENFCAEITFPSVSLFEEQSSIQRTVASFSQRFYYALSLLFHGNKIAR